MEEMALILIIASKPDLVLNWIEFPHLAMAWSREFLLDCLGMCGIIELLKRFTKYR